MKNYAKNNPSAEELLELLKVLRSPSGCPWDREQTRASLRKYMVEETAELADAIDENNPHGICEETGDVLMNLMMQSLVAEENGEFTFADAVADIYDKMLRRHPHVFGSAVAADADAVTKLWDKVKSAEPEKAERTSVLDSVPKSLSALSQAAKLQKKAAKLGFDWQKTSEITAKIDEELNEVKQALADGDNAAVDEEIGDLLFAVVNLARFRKTDPEELLRNANRKFSTRFRYVEERMRDRDWKSTDINELESYWQEAKSLEKKRKE